jgi:hypothetical protein
MKGPKYSVEYLPFLRYGGMVAPIGHPMRVLTVSAVFAVITTVVKYVRTVLHQTGHFARPSSTKLRCRYVRYLSMCTIQIYHLYGQDIAKTFIKKKNQCLGIRQAIFFDRFDSYFYVNI